MFIIVPSQTFTRIYITAPSLQEAIVTNQDTLWTFIKKEKYAIEPGEEHHFWDTLEEENETREKWFKNWTNEDNWTTTGPIAIDMHF